MRFALFSLALALSACAAPGAAGLPGAIVHDPDAAEPVLVDRFSDAAGTFFRRSENEQLPGVNAPVAFDASPFSLTVRLPDGSRRAIYHLDARATVPANLFVFFKPDGAPLAEQLHVFDAVPGEAGYNDFCAVFKVTVPESYVPNTIASRAELERLKGEGFSIEKTATILNMPVVPDGSTAAQGPGGTPPVLSRGWYRNQVLRYFAFDELTATPEGLVPTAPMYAFFGTDETPRVGGFRVTAAESADTQNLAGKAPGAPGYSPLWALSRLAEADFATVLSSEDVPARLSVPPVAFGMAVNAVVRGN